MMPGSKGQKAVHACMIRLLNLGPAKHEEGVICVANQRIPNVCRIAGAACCGAIRGHQLGAKDLLTPTSLKYRYNELPEYQYDRERKGLALHAPAPSLSASILFPTTLPGEIPCSLAKQSTFRVSRSFLRKSS